MGFKCEKCKEAVKEKPKKLVTHIRNVTYNNPSRSVTEYNNADIISNGKETVKEVMCCKECFTKHEKDEVKIVPPNKVVYVKLSETDKKELKEKNRRGRRRNDTDEEFEYAEKYGN